MSDATETTEPPIDEAPVPAAPVRSRRRLIIGIAAGLVAAVLAFVGVLFALSVLNAKTVALYTSEAEQYSVLAPGEATQEKDDLIGAITTTATHWTDGDLFYSVSSTDATDVPPSQRGQFLQAVLAGALKNAPGVSDSSLESSAVTDAFLEAPEETTLSGDPAVSLTVTLEGAPAPFRVVIAPYERTIYMVIVSESDGGDDEGFVDSFTFLSANASGEEPSTEVYVSEAEGYSVEMIGDPQVVESDSLFGAPYTKVQSVWDLGSKGYFIQTVEFPKDYDKPLDQALTDSVAGMVANTPGATVVEDERVDFNGETAAVGVIDAPSGSVRFVIVAHNYRQYLLVAPLEDDSSDEDFIASFKFLD